MRRLIPPALIAGALLAPAIGASAQVPTTGPPILTTTTTTTAPVEETTTTTTAPVEATTTTTVEPNATTTTTATADEAGAESLAGDGGGGLQALAGGSLSISVPPTAQLSAGTPVDAGTLGASLGAVTVSDTRGGLASTWTARVSTTAFTTGAATADETIDAANITYWSGAATATSGVGTFAPGQLTALNAVTLSSTRTAFSLLTGSGDTSATWNPTIIVTIPPSAVIGTYTGTITHSVA